VSRIGKKPVVIPDKVQVTIADHKLTAKGPKGTLELNLPEEIDVNFENNIITFSRPSDDKHIRALHGLARALTGNVIDGVTKGFEKTMQLEGVGYKVEMKGKNLMLSIGFSHPVVILAPDGVEFATPTPNTINVKGIDKQLVGEVAAKIRALRKPEPYKGKGIRYQGEVVRRKAGKTTSK
jgi:large subunit ribosomal protein L6